MKQYRETKNGAYTIDNMSIPHSESNRHYNQMIQEVEAGDAEIIPFDHEAKAYQDSINSEKFWRDQELSRTDIELFKVQDGRGVGLVSDWRDYRNSLRDWPESGNFPNKDFRPEAPDMQEC